MDIAVPISSLPALVDHVAQTLLNNELVGFVIGHAGDGNVHVTMPYNDEATRRRTAVANDTIVYKAIELGGTSTGEHGVGIGKAKFMSREHGAALDVMRTLKQVLDPNGILNPGKIFRPNNLFVVFRGVGILFASLRTRMSALRIFGHLLPTNRRDNRCH